MDINRPILKTNPSKTDILLDRISLLLIITGWVLCFFQYSKLPDTIPIHFNATGEIDGYGHKFTLFLLPGIITLVFTGITILNRHPHLFNYPQQLNEENAPVLYKKATRLIRTIKLVIASFNLLITYTIIESAKAGHSTLRWWLIPAFVLCMIIPVILSVSSVKKKQDIQ